MKKIASLALSALFVTSTAFAQAKLTEAQIESIANQVKSACGTDGIKNNACVRDQVKLKLQEMAKPCGNDANCLANYGLTPARELTNPVVQILTEGKVAGSLTAAELAASSLTTGQIVALSSLLLIGAAAVGGGSSGTGGTGGTGGTN
jgi:hypothetical protein